MPTTNPWESCMALTKCLWDHYVSACVHAQSCLTLCDPMDWSLPDSSLHGILWARILEWVTMPSSTGSFRPRDRTCVSCGSWIAGRFFTAEPLGKPCMYLSMHLTLLQSKYIPTWHQDMVPVSFHFSWLKLYFIPFFFVPDIALLLLLLSRFSRVQLCATPDTAAHQAPPSLGFSRQEHWSGLPFPSPMHESEKWKWSHSVLSDS